MADALTNAVDGLLRQMSGLYGHGDPLPHRTSTVMRDIAHSLRAEPNSVGTDYAVTRTTHAAAADTHADREEHAHAGTKQAGAHVVAGRKAVNGHLADFHEHMHALRPVSDTAFGKTAVLAAAHNTVTNASSQVAGDTEASRRAAEHINSATTEVAEQPARQMRRIRHIHHVHLESNGALGGNAVAAAAGWLGTPYVWGGGGAGGPSGGGFDCSGLVQYAIAHATHGQVILPRTTFEQIHCGIHIPTRDVAPGDLVFPANEITSAGPEHVQLAVGNGMVIEAPHTGAGVRLAAMPQDAVVIRVL